MFKYSREELPNFADYSFNVKQAVLQITPSVVNEISNLQRMYDKGYTILDAVTFFCLMNQELDEDYACQELNRLLRKYDDLYED